MRAFKTVCPILAVVLLFGITMATAQPGDIADCFPLPEGFLDPAFDHYVDLRLAGEALTARDASLLADVALQLAEGERVLLRHHAFGLTARKVMGKAAELAGDTGDKATIDRLIKAAEASGDEEFVADLRAAEKLGAAGRATDPALMIPVETTDVETFAELKWWLDAVDKAAILGDEAALKDLRGTIDATEGLSDEHKKAIAARLDQAIEAVGDQDAEDDLVRMLAGASRSDDVEIPVPPNGPFNFEFSIGPARAKLVCQYWLKANRHSARLEGYYYVRAHGVKIVENKHHVPLAIALRDGHGSGSIDFDVKGVLIRVELECWGSGGKIKLSGHFLSRWFVIGEQRFRLPGPPPPPPQPSVTQVITIRNPTNSPIQYSLTWADPPRWEKVTVSANARRSHWLYGRGQARVRFHDGRPNSYKTHYVASNTLPGHVSSPSHEQGREYVFEWRNRVLDLYHTGR